MAPRKRKGTPIRQALLTTSTLKQHVQNGIVAVKTSDHACLAPEVRSAFADSLDLDAAMQALHAQEKPSNSHDLVVTAASVADTID